MSTDVKFDDPSRVADFGYFPHEVDEYQPDGSEILNMFHDAMFYEEYVFGLQHTKIVDIILGELFNCPEMAKQIVMTLIESEDTPKLLRDRMEAVAEKIGDGDFDWLITS